MLKNDTENTVTFTIQASDLTGVLNYLMNERVSFEVKYRVENDVEQIVKTRSFQ